MSKIHFTTLGAKLKDANPHPLFIVDRMYPANHFYLILSDEPHSKESDSVEENLAEITKILNTTGVSYETHYLVLENFWENVGTLTEMILNTKPEDEIILNFSTGRRVFVSSMVLAGSLAKGWMPSKKITCVQTSKAYEKVVSFEPSLPMIPDNDDRIIMKKIDEFEKELETNEDAKLTTDEIGEALKKGQSTISTRLKKLTEADYVEIKGHSKFLKPKGRAILHVMNNLAEKKFETFDAEAQIEKKRRSKEKWKKYRKPKK